MKVVTAREMREIDQKTIGEYGVTGRMLMERAGAAVAARIKEQFQNRNVIVVAGGGNNGGDGIVCARELFNSGWDVKVFMISGLDRLSLDCSLQIDAAKKAGVAVEFRKEITKKDLQGALIVDAILGTGLNKDVKGTLSEIISAINISGSPVVSIDMSSGISSDTGSVMGIAVRADCTVAFGLPKRGHFLHPGAEYAGKLFVDDIGFPEGLICSDKLRVEVLEKKDISALIPDRREYSHKGDYGHALVVAGSRGKTGAAIMTARACMRAGAGLVTVAVPESLTAVFQSRVTEEMVLPLPEAKGGSLSPKAMAIIGNFLSEKADVLCIGPGIGVSGHTRRLVSEIIKSSGVPVVVDADGINSITDVNILKKASSPVILTPHAGEMARLMRGGCELIAEGDKLEEKKLLLKIEQSRIDTAISFAEDIGVYLVLKGVPTVVAEPAGMAYINSTGNPGMATAGAGDVLTGIIGSLLGQGLKPSDASIAGVYIHGLAGDIAASEKGEYSLIASDIIEFLPRAFKEVGNARGQWKP